MPRGRLTGAAAAAQWLWSAGTPAARAARAALVPLAAAYAGYMGLRTGAYRRGLLPSHALGVPTIGVGNLTIGGTGKTPITSWIAAQCARQGIVPGIVLRGYGHDEEAVHAERVPGAIVVTGRDRPAAARRAVSLGAGVVILDDAFQRLDLRRDLNLLLVSAESSGAPAPTLPAGPWREPWRAARRADLVVITRKSASPEQVARVAERLGAAGIAPQGTAVAHLNITRFAPLLRGQSVEPPALCGKRVLAACAVADPASFVEQLSQMGADVQPAIWRDHYPFGQRDLQALLSAAAHVDYVVVTHKDAGKLRGLWPADAPPALVAQLEVQWEHQGELVLSRLSTLLTIG